MIFKVVITKKLGEKAREVFNLKPITSRADVEAEARRAAEPLPRALETVKAVLQKSHVAMVPMYRDEDVEGQPALAREFHIRGMTGAARDALIDKLMVSGAVERIEVSGQAIRRETQAGTQRRVAAVN